MRHHHAPFLEGGTANPPLLVWPRTHRIDSWWGLISIPGLGGEELSQARDFLGEGFQGGSQPIDGVVWSARDMMGHHPMFGAMKVMLADGDVERRAGCVFIAHGRCLLEMRIYLQR